ncbi:hypothetical protein AC96_2095 [Escherichia coli 2-156-04_S4_C2]|nr:hypothetical protein AC96_2095 [Escherichia coli 2-156-04_S4_C2]
MCHDLFLINYNLMLLGCCPRFLTVPLVSAPEFRTLENFREGANKFLI